MKTAFVAILLLFTLNGHSQVNKYDAATIPPKLKEKAHSIKREEIINFEVRDINDARMSVNQIYTVLDAEAEEVLVFRKYSDPFKKLENAEIKVFDASGKMINKYKMKEMYSQAVGGGLIEDSRVHYFRVTAASYPITVQYEFQYKYKGTLDYPDFDIAYPDQSIEHAQFSAKVPAELDLKYKAKNIDLHPKIGTEGKYKTYNWEINNFPAIVYEQGSVSFESNYPTIMIAPNKFSMDGYNGDLSSWKNFGYWYRDLSKGSLNLPEEKKVFLKELVNGVADDKDKIKMIYKYLQSNFRYVSIQLGIGGYKTFDAKYVDKKKYGDCKALTNYMQACLEAINIPSYPALINAQYDKEPVDPLFPHNSFNHVILCIIKQKDTTWLECTSTSLEAGVLGGFTENRNALLITPEGGVLVPTPKSKAAENVFQMTSIVTIEPNGSGSGKSKLISKGMYQSEINHYIIDETKDDQKEYLVQKLGFLQPDEFSLSIDTSHYNDLSLDLKFEKIPDFVAGSKMFLHPRIYKIWNSKLPITEKRTKDFYFQSPFIKIDTTVYVLPADYTFETLPKAKSFKSEFGSFQTSYSFDETKNTISTTVFLQLTQHIIPADKYDETLRFFSRVIEEYTEKVIIKRK